MNTPKEDIVAKFDALCRARAISQVFYECDFLEVLGVQLSESKIKNMIEAKEKHLRRTLLGDYDDARLRLALMRKALDDHEASFK